jgi:hypothetical protein
MQHFRFDFPPIQGSLEAVGATGLTSTIFLVTGGLDLWFGCLTGGFALYYIRASIGWRERLGYSVASFLIALTLAPFMADLILHYLTDLPETLRPAVGFVTVLIALPLVTIIRAFWRGLEQHPERVFTWLAEKIPFLRGRRDGPRGPGDPQ